MTGRLPQLLTLALLSAAAVATPSLRTGEAEPDLGSFPRELSESERSLQLKSSLSNDSCATLYMNAFSAESKGFFNSLCSLSGLVTYKLGNINAISTNNWISTTTGSGLTSAVDFQTTQFTTDLDTYSYSNLKSYCQCRAYQAGCDTLTDCDNENQTLHYNNLRNLSQRLSTAGGTTRIDNPYQASMLLDYVRNIPEDKCLSLCT